MRGRRGCAAKLQASVGVSARSIHTQCVVLRASVSFPRAIPVRSGCLWAERELCVESPGERCRRCTSRSIRTQCVAAVPSSRAARPGRDRACNGQITHGRDPLVGRGMPVDMSRCRHPGFFRRRRRRRICLFGAQNSVGIHRVRPTHGRLACSN